MLISAGIISLLKNLEKKIIATGKVMVTIIMAGVGSGPNIALT